MTDVKCRQKHSNSGNSPSCSTDELGVVMQKA